MTERKEAGTKTFDEVKEEISQRLTQERQKAAYDKFMADLKSKAEITINETALGAPKTPETAPAPAEEPAAPAEEKE